MSEMIDEASTIQRSNSGDATGLRDVSTAKNMKVAHLSKSYRGCRYYRPIKGAAIDKHPCILNDLCDQRQITDCPVRIAYCQNMGESDDDFASFLADHNLTPEMNLDRFYAARGRVC